MPAYTVIIHTPQELNHSSYIQTGLFELEKKGVVAVKVQLYTKKNLGFSTVNPDGSIQNFKQPHQKTSYYTLLEHKSGKKIRFATDLYDHAQHFSTTALQQCDFYFKRNYESRFVEPLQNMGKAEIAKLGITFGTLSTHRHSIRTLKVGLYVTNFLLHLKWDRKIVKRLWKNYNFLNKHWKFTNNARYLNRFENLEHPKDAIVMFQTRCFLHENDSDVQQIHQQRYKIIKLLKSHFPDQFKGGFIPSKIATENYSDALTNVPTDPEAYLDAMKRAKIVIYTRGLANSPAWKMAEYLSQGKVIIAEPMTTELPVPLTEGKELLYFRSQGELLDKVKMALDDQDLATTLSANARAYFLNYVHPLPNTKRILEHMLQKPLLEV